MKKRELRSLLAETERQFDAVEKENERLQKVANSASGDCMLLKIHNTQLKAQLETASADVERWSDRAARLTTLLAEAEKALEDVNEAYRNHIAEEAQRKATDPVAEWLARRSLADAEQDKTM